MSVSRQWRVRFRVSATELDRYGLNRCKPLQSALPALRGRTAGHSPDLVFHDDCENANGSNGARLGRTKTRPAGAVSFGFGVVYADDGLCTLWAKVSANARAAGKGMSPQDAWRAATALALNAPLAANNRSDFEHVLGLQLPVF